MKLEQWQKFEYTGMKPGLGRIRKFLERAGSPEKRFKTVHIAGTNGKGSTAKMISAVLTESGYKTGLYTSPHLVRLTERIRINGKEISRKKLDELTRKYTPLARRQQLSFFEFITGIALLYFAERKIDIAVLETGLGGRFDATNVVAEPMVSVITDIDYDHQQLLGNTLEKIAFEKAGIIKRFRPVVSGVRIRTAEKVIRKRAAANKAQLIEIDKDFKYVAGKTDWLEPGQQLIYTGRSLKTALDVSLLGGYQVKNAAVAAAVCEVLQKQGISLTAGDIQKALSTVRWPGRFELLSRSKKHAKQLLLLDGAHNPGGMKKLIETLKRSPWGSSKRPFIFGVMGDKDYAAMIRIAAKAASKVFLVPVKSARAASVEKMAAQWKKYRGKDRVVSVNSYKEALAATAREEMTVVTGSLYLIGDILKLLKRG